MTKKSRKELKKTAGLVIMLIGLMVFLFPYYNIVLSQFQTRNEIENYDTAYNTGHGADRSESILKKSEEYNRDLSSDYSGVVDPFIVRGYRTYNKVLKDRNDIFGFIAIPKINEVLPIYLGADDEHLANGAAQLAYTSLPVGGEDTRCVIAGHRGYYKKSMFRHLDKMKKGDKVYIYALNRKLVYEVYSTEEIFPSENDKLEPVKDKDILTLLTCTPYPTNRKRLLVNCERVEEPLPSQTEGKDVIEKSISEDMKFKKADFKVVFVKCFFIFIITAGTVLAVFIVIKIIKTLMAIFKKKN